MEIPEKWTQEPPCFAITIWCAIKIAHQQTCVTVLATAHAAGLVPLRAKPSAGAMKSECGSRVYTDRVVEVVNISQNTGMDLG